MWLPDPITIEVQRNAQTDLGFEIWDETSNAPVDLTGYSMFCGVAYVNGATPLVQYEVLISDPPNGLFQISFDGVRLAQLEGKMEKVNLAFEVKANDAAANAYIAARGTIILTPGIL